MFAAVLPESNVGLLQLRIKNIVKLSAGTGLLHENSELNNVIVHLAGHDLCAS